MPRGRSSFLAGTVFLLSLFVVAISHGTDSQPAPWQADLKSAWQKAQAAKRPLVIVVAMDGCYYCEQLRRNTLQDPQVLTEIQQSYVSAAVKAAQAANLTQKLQIRSFPTTVIISHEGRVLDTISGYVPPQEFRARLLSNEHSSISRAPDLHNTSAR